MSDNRISYLKKIYNETPQLFEESRKAEGALKDVFPDKPLVANTLLSALKIGVLHELLLGTNTLPIEVQIPQIAQRLLDEYGVTRENAVQAVGIWAEVVGKVTEEQLSGVTQRFVMQHTHSAAQTASYPSSVVQSSNTTNQEMRKCPFCAELILKEAKLCKHCHSKIEMMECPVCRDETPQDLDDCVHCDTNFSEIAEREAEEKNSSFPNRWGALRWSKVSKHEMNWDEATEYCEKLGGRLPTKSELAELYATGNAPSKEWFWSSTTYAGGTDYAWVVSFDNGVVRPDDKINDSYIRCVRRKGDGASE